MSELNTFDLQLPPRLLLPFRLDRVLEGEASIYTPETDTRVTFQTNSDVRLFDDGSLTFETTYHLEDGVSKSCIDYVRLADGTTAEVTTRHEEPFSRRVGYNCNPDQGIVGQVLDLRQP